MALYVKRQIYISAARMDEDGVYVKRLSFYVKHQLFLELVYPGHDRLMIGKLEPRRPPEFRQRLLSCDSFTQMQGRR
jgi:hypothetical protein